MKTVPVKSASIKILTSFVGHIGKYVPGTITKDKLPISVQIQDIDSKEIFQCKLISVLPFNEVIPEILCFHSEGKSPADCENELLTRSNVSSVNQLAYYLYERHQDQH